MLVFLIQSLINIFDEPFVFNQTYTILIYHAGARKRPIATAINSSNPSENIPLNTNTDWCFRIYIIIYQKYLFLLIIKAPSFLITNQHAHVCV